MARRCQITGRGTRVGKQVTRRGLPKRQGGIGLNTTGVTKRKFKPNIQKKRIFVPELGRWVRVKLCTSALRDIDKKGAYAVLLKAGLIKPAKPGSK